MTIIHREGWDNYTGIGTQVGIGSRQNYTLGGSSHSLGAGRYGGQALNLFTASVVCPWDSAAANFTWSGSMIFAGQAGTSVREILRHGTLYSQFISNAWSWYNSSGFLGSISTTVINSPSSWYDVQMEVVNSTTTGGRLSIYINGNPTPALNLTGISTSQATCNYTQYGPGPFNNQPNIWFDDCVVNDSATRLPYLVKIDTISVDTDGSTLNFTPSTGTNHSAMVDEIPATTTDWLSGSTIGQKDELGVVTYPNTPAAIYEVSPYMFVQKMDAGTRAMALDLISGATTSAGADYYLSGSGSSMSRALAVDPNTGVAWTPSGIGNSILVPRITV